MSESDWRLTGCMPGAPDELCLEAVSAVASVLDRGTLEWVDLIRESRGLIVSSQRILRAAGAPASHRGHL
jgi:hypothetical protein